MRKLLFFGLIFVINSVFASSNKTEVPDSISCTEQLKLVNTNSLSMDYLTFDQTPGKGLRSFGPNCQYEAFQATYFYMKNKKGLNDTQVRNLSFHAGQALASSGREDEAIKFFEGAKSPENTSELLWNEYINATIAFLKKDLKSLKTNRDLIAEKTDYFGNKINLRVVDQFISKFDQNYTDIK